MLLIIHIGILTLLLSHKQLCLQATLLTAHFRPSLFPDGHSCQGRHFLAALVFSLMYCGSSNTSRSQSRLRAASHKLRRVFNDDV